MTSVRHSALVAGEQVELQDVCQVIDCPHSTPELTDDGPFIARSQDVRSGAFRTDQAAHVSEETYRGRIARAEPRWGDLLYSREGTYFGIAAEVPHDVRVCLGQRMVLLRPDPQRIGSRYLRYWLNSPPMAAHVAGFRDGSVAERLNVSTIRRLPVVLPLLEHQRAIGDILGALDDKIELNRRTNETLDSIVRASFKSSFVAGDPQHESKTTSVGSLAALVRDTVEPQAAPATVFEHYSIPAFDAGMTPVREAGARIKSAKTRIPRGAVLLSKLNPSIERVWIPADSHEHPAICSTEFLVLRPQGVATRSYLYGLCTSAPFKEALTAGATGTSNSHQRARPGDLLRIEVPAPVEELVREYDDTVSPLLARIQQNRDEMITLASLRDTLLPRLLSGELRVPDAEPLVAV